MSRPRKFKLNYDSFLRDESNISGAQGKRVVGGPQFAKQVQANESLLGAAGDFERVDDAKEI
jgi:hypothetical protein